MKSLERKIPPPAVALFCGALLWFLPLSTLRGSRKFFWGVALGFSLLGILIDLWALGLFFRKKTTINPLSSEKTSSLVTTGIYGLTRNPMYLGMVCYLLALGFWKQSLFTPFIVILFVRWINRFQIQPEEDFLEEKFGDEFAFYQSQTPRWIAKSTSWILFCVLVGFYLGMNF